MSKRSVYNVQGMSGTITYILTRKQVKNVNLRIHRDGEIHVSAHSRVPLEFIDEWILSKEEFIRSAQERVAKEQVVKTGEKKPRTQRTTQEDKARALAYLDPICRETWQLLQARGIKSPATYPNIRFRTMTSRWGSCIPGENVITLNTRLLEQPREFVEYVVLHEFAHFT